MRLFALLPFAALAGCIIYDTEGKCTRCGDDDVWYGDTGGITDPGDDPAEEEDPAPVYTLTLTPAEGVPGETLIASLTAEGEFNLADIQDVEFVGGSVEVTASSLRQTELLLTLAVSADAALGPVDLLVYLPESQVDLIDGAFEVVAVSGGADDGTDGGGTDGGGTGDGGTDTDSGGTDSGGSGDCE